MESLEIQNSQESNSSAHIPLLRHVRLALAGIAATLVIVLVLSVVTLSRLSALSFSVQEYNSDSADSLPSSGTSDVLSGLPAYEKHTWKQVEALATGTSLTFAIWSPDGRPSQRYVDSRLKPQVLQKFGIQLSRVPARGTCDSLKPGANLFDFICKIKDEVDGKRTGTIDLVWINGVHFNFMKSQGLLYGPFAPVLPQAALHVDFASPENARDAGMMTEGYEMPFHIAQSVFIYNKRHVMTPPKTIPELMDWIKANPGRFIYSKDFTGQAFVRHVFYHFAGVGSDGSWKDFVGEQFDEQLYSARAPRVWEALREIEPYLYNPGNDPWSSSFAGNTWYPDTHAEVSGLVANETIWFDLSYQYTEASSKIIHEQWPDTMQAYTLDDGSLSNTNFLAIPVNSPNKAAALVVANYLKSPGAMFERATPEGWGALQAFDSKAADMMEWDVAFDYIQSHNATPSVEVLQAARLPELSAEYQTRINQDWISLVADQ